MGDRAILHTRRCQSTPCSSRVTASLVIQPRYDHELIRPKAKPVSAGVVKIQEGGIICRTGNPFPTCFGGSSNGRTADSESVCGGSNPPPPAKKALCVRQSAFLMPGAGLRLLCCRERRFTPPLASGSPGRSIERKWPATASVPRSAQR